LILHRTTNRNALSRFHEAFLRSCAPAHILHAQRLAENRISAAC
jgi:hypothetical protein